MRKGYVVSLGIAGWVALGAGGFLVFLWLMQDRMTFHPSRLVETTPAALALPHEEVRIHAPDGPLLTGWWVPGPPGSPSVLFLHGNAGNVSHRLFQLRQLHEAGLGVLIVDYRGYGESTGSPSEKGLARDARASWDHLTGHLGQSPSRILLYGESIGSAPALSLARDLVAEGSAPAGIILEGAFTSALEMARRAFPFLPLRWILRLEMDNLRAVREIELPILFIHGSRDEIVPLRMGRTLHEASVSPVKEFLEVPGAMHNTVWISAPEEVRERIRAFALEAARAPEARRSREQQ